MATGKDEGQGPGLKVAVMASAGAAVEWYDFFIYGTAAALVFPKLFFPADLPPFVAQIASFSTFAVGFIARPLGGALFGHYGDRHGRKRALVLAMFLMGISTTLIGLLPSYAYIGVAAPLLLVAMRFAQGLAVGGQWGGAALLAIESAPVVRRGFYSSFVQVGVPLGVVLANVVFLAVSTLTPEPAFLSWGWRIGFLLSIALIGIGVVLHLKVVEPESQEGPEEPASVHSPLLRAILGHWRTILLAGGAFVANNVCFYIAITYAIAYGTGTVGIPRETLLAAVMTGSAVMIPALMICGALSDRYGRMGVFLLGALLSGLWAFAVFPLLETGSAPAIFAAIAVQLVFVSMMYGPQAALFAELFPRSVRYSGASLGYQIGAVFGGGFAPIIATALFARYQSSLPIAVYLAAVCAISFVCVLALRRRAPTT
ncbi:MFS transporter [Caulobacter sp. SLTY]|uniref:MFS transporter n=1 Tax=Caulobacter sp. SLTY TaxID=2683262 RepID=UPI0014132073|nr:MFS transporter [Caulobacter sp. SLTY]NBB15148.1 MFS transporter [Caulobacter sp. SLTY]